MRSHEFIDDAVDPRIIDQQGGFDVTKTFTATPNITYRAESNGYGDITITAWDQGRRVGTLPLTASDLENSQKATLSVEKGHVVVNPKYQRRGIATQMYLFAKELGNDIRRSASQTSQGKALWDKRLSKELTPTVGQRISNWVKSPK